MTKRTSPSGVCISDVGCSRTIATPLRRSLATVSRVGARYENEPSESAGRLVHQIRVRSDVVAARTAPNQAEHAGEDEEDAEPEWFHGAQSIMPRAESLMHVCQWRCGKRVCVFPGETGRINYTPGPYTQGGFETSD